MDNIKPKEMFPDKPKYASSSWYLANIPAYREKNRRWAKASTQKVIDVDPEAWRQKRREEANAKYQNDPVWAEKRRQTQKAYTQRKKAEKEAKKIQEAVGNLLHN